MKSTVEYTEAEFIALITLADKMFERLMSMDGKTVLPAAPVANEPDWDGEQEHEFAYETPPKATLPKWAKSAHHYEEVVSLGHSVLSVLVWEWASNLGVEDAPQPDRGELMRSLSTGPNSGAVLAYCEKNGGLLRAIDSIYVTHPKGEDARREMVNLIGSTMCQVGSILFPDIATMYEHVDIYRTKGVK